MEGLLPGGSSPSYNASISANVSHCKSEEPSNYSTKRSATYLEHEEVERRDSGSSDYDSENDDTVGRRVKERKRIKLDVV